ncbi:MAG: exosortase-associated EpsI family protein [Deltaproteobacteria bacterium]|nr:exosortase-associated EpsI family protein [Deltaproteobacteria bacterium]
MSEAGNDPIGGLASALRAPLTWGILAALGLGAFVYYPLFFPPSHAALTVQSEEFFFEANEAAGAPVLVLSLWLFYRRSHYLDVLRGPGRPLVAGLVLGATVLLFAWGVYTRATDLQLASVMGLLAGSVLLLGGTSGLRAYWLPILFLAFALPLSPVLLAAVMYPIQLATASYAGAILNLINVPSYVQGDQILRPEGTFIVIETCSGIRTVITLTMLTVLLIDLFERRGWHAALLIVLAPIVAFLTNGARVVTLVLNPHSDVASVHNLQGIGMLLVGLTAMYLLDGLIERWLPAAKEAGEEDPIAIVPDSDTQGHMLLRVLVVCGVLVVLIAASRTIPPWSFPRAIEEMPEALLVRVFDDWPSVALEDDYQFRGSVRYLAWAKRRLEVDGGPVEVFLGIAEEQQRRYSILSPRLPWPESGYAAIDSGSVHLTWRAGADEGSSSASDAVGHATQAERLILRRGAKSVLSYSWFERDRGLFVEWLRQALAIDRSPLARPRHMLALRLSANLGVGGTGVEAAEARLRQIYERLAPELADFAPTFGR